MKIDKITNYVWFKIIAIALIAAFLWNDIAMAGDFFCSNDSTLAITPFSSDPERSGVAWAMMICKTVEDRAAKNYNAPIYLDDILLWKNSIEREFRDCKFDVSSAYEITISIPESDIKIRYFDPDPPALNKPSDIPLFSDSTKLNEKVINDHLRRQIIYTIKSLPAPPVSLADELTDRGITVPALAKIIASGRKEDEIIRLVDGLTAKGIKGEAVRKIIGSSRNEDRINKLVDELTAKDISGWVIGVIIASKRDEDEIERLMDELTARGITVSALSKIIASGRKEDEIIRLVDGLTARGIRGDALWRIISSKRFKDEIKELKGWGEIKLSPDKFKKLARSIIDQSGMEDDFLYTWQEIKDAGILSKEEITILEKHYLEKMTLEEIGDLKEYGVTKERIRQREERAIRKIGSRIVDGHLIPIQIKPPSNILPDHEVNAVDAAYGSFVRDKSGIVNTLLADSPDNVLLRVPIGPLKEMDEDEREEVRAFLETFQESERGYVELYSSEGIGALPDRIRKDYVKKELPEGFKRSRENTITLFEVVIRDKMLSLSLNDICSRLGDFTLTPLDTIISPVDSGDDTAGVVRSTFLGLELMYLARQNARNETIDTEFALDVTRSYNTLYGSIMNTESTLTPDDIIALATGKNSQFLHAFHNLIKHMPITPIDKELLHRIRENSVTVIHHA